MSIPSGLEAYKRSYQISPIILVGGLAEGLPGNVLPIVSLLASQNFPGGPTQPGDGGSAPSTINQDGSESDIGGGEAVGGGGQFGLFEPVPGGTVIDNLIGQYPFANQSVAANAIITQPLTVSLRLICPVSTAGGYAARLAAFTNLQNQLAKHSSLGGVFNVATPSFLYTNTILTKLQDVTDGQTKQAQAAWRFDFFQPLLTLAEAQAAQNLLMRKLDMGLPLSGDPPQASGQQVGVGSSATLQGPSVVPAAQPLGGAAGSGANR